MASVHCPFHLEEYLGLETMSCLRIPSPAISSNASGQALRYWQCPQWDQPDEIQIGECGCQISRIDAHVRTHCDYHLLGGLAELAVI